MVHLDYKSGQRHESTGSEARQQCPAQECSPSQGTGRLAHRKRSRRVAEDPHLQQGAIVITAPMTEVHEKVLTTTETS